MLPESDDVSDESDDVLPRLLARLEIDDERLEYCPRFAPSCCGPSADAPAVAVVLLEVDEVELVAAAVDGAVAPDAAWVAAAAAAAEAVLLPLLLVDEVAEPLCWAAASNAATKACNAACALSVLPVVDDESLVDDVVPEVDDAVLDAAVVDVSPSCDNVDAMAETRVFVLLVDEVEEVDEVEVDSAASSALRRASSSAAALVVVLVLLVSLILLKLEMLMMNDPRVGTNRQCNGREII